MEECTFLIKWKSALRKEFDVTYVLYFFLFLKYE